LLSITESLADKFLFKQSLHLDPKENLDQLDQQDLKAHKDLLENVVMME